MSKSTKLLAAKDLNLRSLHFLQGIPFCYSALAPNQKLRSFWATLYGLSLNWQEPQVFRTPLYSLNFIFLVKKKMNRHSIQRFWLFQLFWMQWNYSFHNYILLLSFSGNYLIYLPYLIVVPNQRSWTNRFSFVYKCFYGWN